MSIESRLSKLEANFSIANNPRKKLVNKMRNSLAKLLAYACEEGEELSEKEANSLLNGYEQSRKEYEAKYAM